MESPYRTSEGIFVSGRKEQEHSYLLPSTQFLQRRYCGCGLEGGRQLCLRKCSWRGCTWILGGNGANAGYTQVTRIYNSYVAARRKLDPCLSDKSVTFLGVHMLERMPEYETEVRASTFSTAAAWSPRTVPHYKSKTSPSISSSDTLSLVDIRLFTKIRYGAHGGDSVRHHQRTARRNAESLLPKCRCALAKGSTIDTQAYLDGCYQVIISPCRGKTNTR